MEGWSAWGSAWTGTPLFEADAAGTALRVVVSPQQSFGLNSPLFTVTPGASFTVTITARVPPSASASGDYIVALMNGDSGVYREDYQLASGEQNLGSAITTSDGLYQIELPQPLSAAVSLMVSYAGSDTYWPAATSSSGSSESLHRPNKLW
jgi:hypothetical protein